MKRICRKNIVDSCLDGIKKAFEDYYQITGGKDCGEWLWNAPEYFITVRIFDEIKRKITSSSLTLEDNVDYLLQNAGKRKGRDPKKLRKSGRVDIAVWNKSCEPVGFIEVKHRVYGKSESVSSDLERIVESLNKAISLEFGALTFYLDKKLKNADEGRIENWVKNFLRQRECEINSKDNLKIRSYYTRIKVESNFDYGEGKTNYTRFAYACVIYISGS
jgi:hypothetical protein